MVQLLSHSPQPLMHLFLLLHSNAIGLNTALTH
jgi:hypothetical protein